MLLLQKIYPYLYLTKILSFAVNETDLSLTITLFEVEFKVTDNDGLLKTSVCPTLNDTE